MAFHCLSKKQSCIANQGFASLIATARHRSATFAQHGAMRRLKNPRAKALDFWHTIAYKAPDSLATQLLPRHGIEKWTRRAIGAETGRDRPKTDRASSQEARE